MIEENVNFIVSFLISIFTEGIIIIVICYVVAEFIKRSEIKWIKKINKGYIPIIVSVLGMILSFTPEIFPNDNLRISIMKGFICGASSTGVFEGYKNIKRSIKAKTAETEGSE